MRWLVPLLALSVSAQAGIEKVGTTGGDFLKLGGGARPNAMGDAYVGIADDASGLAYNPAGIAQSLVGEVQATHAQWFQGMRIEDLNALVSLGRNGMLGASLDLLSLPSLTRTEQIADTPDPSQNFREIGSFQPSNLQAGLAYALPVTPDLMAGARLKYLSESIDTAQASTVALDLGVFYRTPIEGVNAGLSVQNLGPALQWKSQADPLPFMIRGGIGYRTLEDKLLLGLEADFPADNLQIVAIGAEYLIADHFYPRVGLRLDNASSPWSAGLGMRLDQWGVDLSVVPLPDLGLTYRGSIQWRFGKPGANLDATQPYASNLEQGRPAVLKPNVNAPDKVKAWGLYIYDSSRSPRLVRRIQGQGPVDAELAWDGRGAQGQALPEGVYWSVLSAQYNSGQILYSKYVKLEIDNSVPQAELSIDAFSLNPKAPGEAYIPTAFRPVLKSGRGITDWRLEILDPQGQVFRSLSGQGPIPETLVWDGKGDHGDDLISSLVYGARFWVKDFMGHEATSAGPLTFKTVFR